VKKSLLITVLLLTIASLPVAYAIPFHWTPDPDYPDYYQKDAALNCSSVQCGPSSATNSLYWMADTYSLPNLKKNTWQTTANTLADNNHMRTQLNNTTYTGDYEKGLAKYINDVGYKNIINENRLAARGDVTPDIEWLKGSVADYRAVELLIGWVIDNPNGADTWVNGHYVSVTGYELDLFYISDPFTNNNSNSDILAFGEALGGTIPSLELTFDFDEFGNNKALYTNEYFVVDLPWELLDNAGQPVNYDYQIAFSAFTHKVPAPSTWLLIVIGIASLNLKMRKSMH